MQYKSQFASAHAADFAEIVQAVRIAREYDPSSLESLRLLFRVRAGGSMALRHKGRHKVARFSIHPR